jgi:hypothetical protein
MKSEIETGSGPVTQNQATRAARLGELEEPLIQYSLTTGRKS